MTATAEPAEYLGHALEERIRVLVANRHWYRTRRDTYPWNDLEHDNDAELRCLLRVRSAGRRSERKARRQYDRIAAAHRDAVEDGWAPLADRGDTFVYPAGVGRLAS